MVKSLVSGMVVLTALSALVVLVIHTPPIPAVATAPAIEQPVK
jgi:hypothetical protein